MHASQPAALEASTRSSGAPTVPAPSSLLDHEVGTEHLVQFYETESFLAACVGRFLRGALSADGGAVVIATAEHLAAIQAALDLEEPSATAARERGQLVWLDAAETLDALLVDGIPDPARFEQAVETRLAALGRRWGSVHAFGEMVALLWKEKRRDAAYALEDLWNAAAERHRFALLCAYPIQEFGEDLSGPAFARVCACHSRVLPPERAHTSTWADPPGPGRGMSNGNGNGRNGQESSTVLELAVAQRRRAEYDLHDFLENALEGIHSVDAEGRVLWANRAQLELLSYEREEYVGRLVEDFHVDRHVARDTLDRLRAGESISNRSVRLRSKTGDIKHVLVSANGHYVDGRLLHTRCFMRDVTEIHRAELDRARLGAIVEGSYDAILGTDLDGRITSWNAGAQRIYGYAAAEVIGASVRLLIPTDRSDEGPEILARLRGGERVAHFETVRRRKDGSLVDVSLTVSPVHDADGVLVGASRIARDVTERRRADRELAAAHERYRRLAELLPVGVYTCSAPLGTVTYYNEQAALLWGRQPAIGDPSDRFCGSYRLYRRDGSMLAHEDCPMAVALREGRTYRNEEVLIERPDGTRVHALVNIDPMLDDSGRVVGAVNVFHDISALKLAREALTREKESLQVLLRTLPVSVFLSRERACRDISGNEAAARLLRMPADGNFSLTAPAGEAPTHYKMSQNGRELATYDLPVQRAARGEVVESEPFDVEFDDGSVVHTLAFARPLFDASGEASGAVACMLDVTELKRSERALRDADRRKDEFLAVLAHELRNPLTPILTGLELLGMAADDAELAARTRAIMTSQTDQLIALVDDLLDVSRITQGKLRLKQAPVELSEILKTAADGSRSALEAGRHRLSVHLPAEPIVLHADRHRLTQVLSNLLTNAAKYSPGGGEILLSAEREGDAQVLIIVQDGGIGIPAGMEEQIFEMFMQVDRPQERGHSGLGIGLTLVRTLVELHGGTVQAESEGLGRGSRFSIRLPVREHGRAGSDPNGSCEPGGAVSKRRVLIVDDNLAALETLEVALTMLGADVRTATDGRHALRVGTEFQPEIVFMDLGMPNMNGYEAARCIRQLSWGMGVSLIAVSGWGQGEHKQRTEEAGFDEHLVKPVRLPDLRRVLEDRVVQAP